MLGRIGIEILGNRFLAWLHDYIVPRLSHVSFQNIMEAIAVTVNEEDCHTGYKYHTVLV